MEMYLQITRTVFVSTAQMNMKVGLMTTGMLEQLTALVHCLFLKMLTKTKSRQFMKKDSLKTCWLKTSLRMIKQICVQSRVVMYSNKAVNPS